ncbi:hypothetical protein K1719_031754 [Acacia pycnantha]|nr:hypothetical protein K1719_031754 [Acacia pycnantha]
MSSRALHTSTSQSPAGSNERVSRSVLSTVQQIHGLDLWRFRATLPVFSRISDNPRLLKPLSFFNHASRNFSSDCEGKYEALHRYVNDLTELASCGKLYPAIVRGEEIGCFLRILSITPKINPVIIAEPGAAKVAIVDGRTMLRQGEHRCSEYRKCIEKDLDLQCLFQPVFSRQFSVVDATIAFVRLRERCEVQRGVR